MPLGYTWQDFLSGKLHIDHIIPIAAFNFRSPGDADFKHCWALKNLRLLPAKENMRKGAKLTAPHQPGLAFG
jgi:5-methylcytosine-specific restriction endonuclease McrA